MMAETIHVMDANETTSEAFKNYASAAFLVGMAIVAVGIGAGMISQSIKNLRKDAASSVTEDLLASLRKTAKAKPTENSWKNKSTSADSAVENLRRTVEDLLGGQSPVINQVTSKDDLLYYVKKSYKEQVKVGSMIPENFLVPKPDSMSMDMFLHMENVKFKSKTVSEIKGGMNLVTVEEIVNSEVVKPV